MTHKSMEALKQHERVHQLTEALVANVTDLAAKLGEDDPPEVVQAAIHNAGIMLAPRTRGTCFCMCKEDVQ